MKKVMVLLLVLVLCVLFVACDPHWGHYSEFGIESTNVVSVQLINYEIPKNKEFKWWMPSFLWRPYSFKKENCTVIETLNEDKTVEFIERLKTEAAYTTFIKYNRYYSPEGVCLKITYSNGNFLIACLGNENGYIGEYTSDGSVVKHYGKDSPCACEALVNQYFEYQFPLE